METNFANDIQKYGFRPLSVNSLKSKPPGSGPPQPVKEISTHVCGFVGLCCFVLYHLSCTSSGTDSRLLASSCLALATYQRLPHGINAMAQLQATAHENHCQPKIVGIMLRALGCRPACGWRHTTSCCSAELQKRTLWVLSKEFSLAQACHDKLHQQALITYPGIKDSRLETHSSLLQGMVAATTHMDYI